MHPEDKSSVSFGRNHAGIIQLLDTEEFNRMMKKNTLIIRILPASDPSYILWLTFPLNSIYESNNPDLSLR